MPKVLFVTTVSGTLRAFLLPFAEHFRSQGWVVDGMAQGITDCSICRNSFDRVWEVNWSRNPLEFNNFIETPKRVKEVVLEEQYDIVHVHTPVAAFITRLALRKAEKNGRPKLYTQLTDFIFIRVPQPIRMLYFFFWRK